MRRVIDAEGAINLIEEFMVIDDWSLVYLPDLHDALELAVEALKEQRPHGEWIPCSERLPEIRFDLNSRTSDSVFVCLENRTMHMAFYCYDNVWRFCESGEAKEPMWDKVIAWMPLPERYGEKARRNE